jgi:osmotically inducible protein OsmC
MATRKGSAEWRGDLKGGEGDLTVGDGVFKGAYSFSSRFEEGEGTNPEELIGAAHAACFTMALSAILAEQGHSPESVRTVATVHLRQKEEGPTIQRIDLETEGRVPGIDEDQFAERAEEAKSGCLVSRALAGVEEMTVAARLAA